MLQSVCPGVDIWTLTDRGCPLLLSLMNDKGHTMQTKQRQKKRQVWKTENPEIRTALQSTVIKDIARMAIWVIFQLKRHSGRQACLFSLSGWQIKQWEELIVPWQQYIKTFLFESTNTVPHLWFNFMVLLKPEAGCYLLLVHRMFRMGNCPLVLLLPFFCFVLESNDQEGRLIPEGVQRQTILSAHFWVILVMTQAAKNTNIVLEIAQILFEVLLKMRTGKRTTGKYVFFSSRTYILKKDDCGWSCPSELKSRTEDITARGEQLTMIVGCSHRKHHTPPAPFLLMALCLFMSSSK